MPVLNFPALCADHLADLLAAKDALQQVLSRGVFQSSLKPIEKEVEELLGILLFDSIRR